MRRFTDSHGQHCKVRTGGFLQIMNHLGKSFGFRLVLLDPLPYGGFASPGLTVQYERTDRALCQMKI